MNSVQSTEFHKVQGEQIAGHGPAERQPAIGGRNGVAECDAAIGRVVAGEGIIEAGSNRGSGSCDRKGNCGWPQQCA